MKYAYYFSAFLFLPVLLSGQPGPLQILDSSLASSGTTHLTMADLNQDGNQEVIASFTGSNGKVGYYQNMGANGFSALTVVDSLAFCKGVAAGDFDQNGHIDLVAIGGIGMEARLYFNSSGTIGPAVPLDSNISIQVNDVVVADFDGNNSDDLVIIGQHSIDFYRNDGSGNFTKEVILTTSTSPKPLECLDLATADVDLDGDMDLICGETAGLVVYTNSGSGQFTPHYYSTMSEIGFVVHPCDVNGDGLADVLMRNSMGHVKWFRNVDTGSMILEAVLPDIPIVYNIKSIDYNQDGQLDLYTSYQHNVSVFLNDSNHSFSTEISIHQSSDLVMGPIAIGNIDNQKTEDYLWAGVINTIAYHLNQNPLGMRNQKIQTAYAPYPNPTRGLLHLQKPATQVVIHNQQGKQVKSLENVHKIDLSALPDGVYYLSLTHTESDEALSHKIVKY